MWKMKGRGIAALLCAMILMLSSCGRAEKTETIPEKTVDIDLSQANSLVVFSQVSNMYAEPWNYLGAVICIRGTLGLYESIKGRRSYMVMVQDASACCAQGIEFEAKNEDLFDNNLLDYDDEIIVTGRFELFQEDGYSRIHLVDAVIDRL